jgi:hypothetical protein
MALHATIITSFHTSNEASHLFNHVLLPANLFVFPRKDLSPLASRNMQKKLVLGNEHTNFNVGIYEHTIRGDSKFLPAKGSSTMQKLKSHYSYA